MTTVYDKLKSELIHKQYKWLVTGVAGFIGSNILETLLKLNQKVVGLDNFITGKKENLLDVQSQVSTEQWGNFSFIEGDICNFNVCLNVTKGIDYVLHQAALGSVPRSLENPLNTNEINITGTLNVFVASRDHKVKRIVYAASSSSYGDHPDLPKTEDKIGRPLSPYAVTKYVNELYADVLSTAYNMELIGLRYFNVFGRRQDPEGAYAAVIPTWVAGMINNESVFINGTGETTRDFCYIDNAVQANILAATTKNTEALNQVYNIAYGQQTSLNDLCYKLRDLLGPNYSHVKEFKPQYRDFRKGDVLHSLADISKAKSLLGYNPTHDINMGLEEALEWYKNIVHSAAT